ncbi:hypothetical protein ACFL27_01390 [candidate division CSSED10-310 bacterium]|uniref:Uncharacterized protein n=1 Tax=candidate division CSSED10-310 bacterium TaxID=2855610 RepID=A0ABV6YRM5_UNCC1
MINFHVKVLSPEKTKSTYIRDGFTFLGQTFRKEGNILHITPAKEGVLALVREVGTFDQKISRSTDAHAD